MASTSHSICVWGRLTYELPSSVGILKSVEISQVRFVIGRAKECDLRVGLKMVSARHCYLSKELDGKVFLYDTSTNGTFVNNTRVNTGQRKRIFDGDKLYLIRKKTSPQEDFHLVFKAISLANVNGINSQDSSDTEPEPSSKRLKVDLVTKSAAKSEEVRETEHLDANPNANAEAPPSTVKTEPFCESEDSEAQPEGGGQDNIMPDSVVKSEPICEEADNIETEAKILSTVQVDNPDVADSDDTVLKNENEQVNDNQEGSLDQDTKDSDSGGMADILKCSLCLEIFHDPVCLQPCLHCYCSGCYSEWMACSNVCPQCRTPVQLLAKNHMISSLTETFLKDNPHRRRSSGDIVLVEAKNKITKDHLSYATNLNLDQSSNSSQNSGYNSPFTNSQQQATPICRECPGNAIANPQPGCSTANQPAKLLCGPNQPHISCSCCFTLFPDRRFQQGVKPQTCSLCSRSFCHMYWGCTKQGCNGCLNKFSELQFSNNNLSSIISDNTVETRILTDYVQSKGNSLQDVIQECFGKLDSGVYGLTVNVTSASILCYKCGLTNLRTLVYYYRSDIQNNNLPNSVTSRPNCYWGKNCRTQVHNINHAQKYNHICNQTRF